MQKYIVTCLMALSPLLSLGCSEDESDTDDSAADEAASNGATNEAETTDDSDDVETTVAAEQPAELGFFVTSTGSGADGGNIGGLTGADAKCQQLATAVGSPRAVRAVGRANGLNRIAIVIPCHRVINKDGSLCGYGGGLARKRHLLDLEQSYANFST